MSDLDGKVIVITGVGRPRGVGRAAALRFAERGARLVLADLGRGDNAIGDIEGTSPDLDAVAHEVTEAGGDAIAVATDVSQEDDVKKLIATSVAKFGRIDSMVANAAILAGKGDPLDISLETFMRIQEVNVAGVFLCLRESVRQILSQGGGGSLVTVGSRASRRGDANITAYSASKFGVIGLTQSFRHGLCEGRYSRELRLSGRGRHRYVCAPDVMISRRAKGSTSKRPARKWAMSFPLAD